MSWAASTRWQRKREFLRAIDFVVATVPTGNSFRPCARMPTAKSTRGQQVGNKIRRERPKPTPRPQQRTPPPEAETSDMPRPTESESRDS